MKRVQVTNSQKNSAVKEDERNQQETQAVIGLDQMNFLISLILLLIYSDIREYLLTHC